MRELRKNTSCPTATQKLSEKRRSCLEPAQHHYYATPHHTTPHHEPHHGPHPPVTAEQTTPHQTATPQHSTAPHTTPPHTTTRAQRPRRDPRQTRDKQTRYPYSECRTSTQYPPHRVPREVCRTLPVVPTSTHHTVSTLLSHIHTVVGKCNGQCTPHSLKSSIKEFAQDIRTKNLCRFTASLSRCDLIYKGATRQRCLI